MTTTVLFLTLLALALLTVVAWGLAREIRRDGYGITAPPRSHHPLSTGLRGLR